jgi:glycerophosphoryl diester phosphodiesterase
VAAPVVSGSTAIRSTSNSTVLDISAIANGSWMVVSVMSSGNTAIVTPPATWSVLHAVQTSGTRRNFLFAKLKDSVDGTSVTFTQDTIETTAYSLTWGTGSGNITSWTVGASWIRTTDSVEVAGSRYNNVAKSITTPLNDQLVLAISHEATNSKVQPMEITTISPSGWTQNLWLEQVAANDRIETIWIGSKSMPVSAVTGDLTLTYSTPSDTNGWTIQLAISSPPSTPPPPAPYVVGTPVNFLSTTTPVSTSFTIAHPTGVVLTGDYIIVVLRGQYSSSVTPPSSTGFTRLGAAFVGPSSDSRIHGFYGRPVTDASTEPASYTFTVDSTTANRFVATCFVVRGVDLANPVAGFNNNYSGTSITGGRRTQSYALNAVPVLSLFFGGSEFASPNDHAPTLYPTGYTEITSITTNASTSSSRTYLWVGKKEVVQPPVMAADIQWAVASGSGAEAISLRGTSSSLPEPAGDGFVARNGSGNPVTVYYKTATGARTPSALIPMRRGFKTVTEMLAKTGFTWAHRGGSGNFPEMSLYGYTQAVARGYGVLEVSLARTSDGVWFGLHDQTTDRTSGGTFGNASSQTWAQIQAQQNTLGPQGAPQPYMRWEQLIAAYGSTHIIVADPKYALASFRVEFLNMVNRDLGPTKAIIKFSGSGSGAVFLSNAAKAMGFQTWGFFYAADASAAQGGNGNLQTWGNDWTLIGMEYTASQAIFDEAKAFGKPVIAHIVPDQAGYNAAIAKGAVGAQVSHVMNVAPVSWWTP